MEAQNRSICLDFPGEIYTYEFTSERFEIHLQDEFPLKSISSSVRPGPWKSIHHEVVAASH